MQFREDKKKDAIKKLTNHHEVEITEQTDSNSEITESNSELNPRNSELTETNSKSTENSSESTDNKSTEGSDYFKTDINDDHRRSKNRKKMPRKNKRILKRRKSK